MIPLMGKEGEVSKGVLTFLFVRGRKAKMNSLLTKEKVVVED